MYTLGHQNNVYQGCTRYNEHRNYIHRSQKMYTLGHHNNVYPGFTRYNEHSYYIDKSQQCIPWVIITMCMQSTQGIINKVSTQIDHSSVYPG